MSEQGMSVDLTQLDIVTTKIRGFASFVTDQLALLDEQARSITGSWTGASASAYQEAHVEWVEGAKDVDRGVGTMENAARAAHGNYGAATTANVKMFDV
ncbi:WXG100 family type VII secretion target [Nocardia thailandica]|uniref:WXG100 family type VII secretion target n=1 Tax=Nocardia thailandica TaxID=257275 RepID=UPI0005B87042|nr:WXG100 family type VII secretion target [Nocardia thailandica]